MRLSRPWRDSRLAQKGCGRVSQGMEVNDTARIIFKWNACHLAVSPEAIE